MTETIGRGKSLPSYPIFYMNLREQAFMFKMSLCEHYDAQNWPSEGRVAAFFMRYTAKNYVDCLTRHNARKPLIIPVPNSAGQKKTNYEQTFVFLERENYSVKHETYRSYEQLVKGGRILGPLKQPKFTPPARY